MSSRVGLNDSAPPFDNLLDSSEVTGVYHGMILLELYDLLVILGLTPTTQQRLNDPACVIMIRVLLDPPSKTNIRLKPLVDLLCNLGSGFNAKRTLLAHPRTSS